MLPRSFPLARHESALFASASWLCNHLHIYSINWIQARNFPLSLSFLMTSYSSKVKSSSFTDSLGCPLETLHPRSSCDICYRAHRSLPPQDPISYPILLKLQGWRTSSRFRNSRRGRSHRRIHSLCNPIGRFFRRSHTRKAMTLKMDYL